MSLLTFVIVLTIFTVGLAFYLSRGRSKSQFVQFNFPASDGQPLFGDGTVGDLPVKECRKGKKVTVLKLDKRGSVTDKVAHTGELVAMMGHYKAIIRKDDGTIVKRSIYRTLIHSAAA